jgi:hypothetical protein
VHVGLDRERRFDRPVIAITLAPRRLIIGSTRRISSDSPELEITITTSSEVIIPGRQWLASPGCMKKAGVPVDASVDAILRATCPDLPMPLTDRRGPWCAGSAWSAAMNFAPSGPRGRAPPRLDVEHVPREREKALRVGEREGL